MLRKIKDIEKIDEFSWNDILSYWMGYINTYSPILKKPIEIKSVHVNYHNEGYFYGYDWILKNNFELHTSSVSEHPDQYLLFGTALNKGTLHTLEMLDCSKDNKEEQAAIWIGAFVKDMLDYLPKEWYGEGAIILNKMSTEVRRILNSNNNYYTWHHAMRNALPEICFSYNILHNIKISSYKQIVELASINVVHTLSNYVAVQYDSKTA